MGWGFPVPAPDAPLRARALRLLARREHSREELRRKLAPHAPEGADVESLLDEFASRGWLSETRFIEQTVRSKSGRFGPLRIAQVLREKGVDEAGVAEGLAQARVHEAAALEAVWRSRFGRSPADAAEKARQVRFLQGRGFALDDVLRLLRKHAEGRP